MIKVNKDDATKMPRLTEPPYWVLLATGEGSEALVVPHATVFDEVHKFMCFCKLPWRKCQTLDMQDTMERIDDTDYWVFDEAGRKFACELADNETGKVTLYALYHALPPAEAETEAESEADSSPKEEEARET